MSRNFTVEHATARTMDTLLAQQFELEKSAVRPLAPTQQEKTTVLVKKSEAGSTDAKLIQIKDGLLALFTSLQKASKETAAFTRKQ